MVANLLITTNVMGVAEADTQLGRLERTADRTERQVEQLGQATQRTATSTDRQAVSSRTATTAIRAQGQATRTAARESIRFNETTRNTASNLRDIAIIGAVVGVGIGAGSRVIRSAVSEYLEFDRALTQVNTIARLADPALARLSSRAVEFASLYGNSSADQASGYYQIISAGITQSTRALDVWDASNRAAFAGQAELPAVISAVTTAFNNYPDAFRDAAEATDAYLAVVERGQTNLPTFARNIPNILPQLRAAGVEIRDGLAVYAGLTSLGISDPRTVTRIDALLRVNRRASDRTLEARRQLGIQDVDPTDLPAYLQAINRSTAGLSSESRNRILEDLANGESEAFSAISAGAGGALPVIVTFNDTLRDTVGLTEANLDIRIESNAGQVDRALGDLNTSLEQIGDALVFTFVPAFRSVAESISFATDNLETFFSIAALGAGALAARGIATGARIAGPANRLRVQRIERLPSSLTTPRDRVNFPPGARGTEEFQRSELNRVSDLARETQQINQYADAQVRATRTGGGLIASAAAGTIALDVFGDTVDATSVLLTTLPFAFVASSVLSLSKSVVTAIPGVNTLNSAFSNNTRALIASRDQAIALEGIYRGAGQSTRTFNERLGRISMRSINAGNDLSRFGRVVGRTGGVVQGTTRRIGNLTTAFGTAIGPAGRFGNAFRGTIPQIRRSSAALIALRAGISLIGGPIGLAIAGVGALGLAYALYGDRLTDVKGVNDEVTDSVKDLIIANEELYQGYAQASLRTRPIVEGQYRVAIATFDTTQEIYRQASANLTLLLSRDNLLRQQRDNPNAFGQGQQGDLASGIVLSAQALTVAEANLDRLGVLLGDATANRERLRRELDNGVFPEPGNGGLLLTGTGGIVNDLNLIQDETRELSDIFANNLTSAVDSAADAIGDFATDGVNSIQTLNEALSETVMGFGQGLISDSISNTFRQVGQSGLTGANGALQITAQGSALLGIPQGGASGPFSASSLAASQAQTQATLTQFFGSGFGSTGFGTALSSFAAVVGPAAGLFGATLVAGQLLERVIGRNRDVAIEGTAGGGSIDSVDVRQRRSGLSGFLLGRNNRRELSAGEDAVINQVFRPLFRTIDMIEETSGRAFSSVMFSGESATQAAADYANGVASQVGGVTRFNEAGESLIDTLDRLATGTEATNVAFNRAGFGDLIRGEFAQGLLDGIGGAGNIAATLGLRTDAQQRRLAEQEIARQQGVSGLGVGSTNQQLLNEISFLTLTIRQQSSVFQPGIDQAQSRLDFVTRNAAAFAPSELIRARNDLQRREDSLEGIIAPNLERLQTLTGLVDEFALVNTPSQRIQLGSSGFVNEAEQRLAESAQSNPETQRQEMIDIFRQILNDGTAGDRGIIDALGDARTADRLARGLTRS